MRNLNEPGKIRQIGADCYTIGSLIQLATMPGKAYIAAMIRFFDMADHARLPWRFTHDSRSVLARA